MILFGRISKRRDIFWLMFEVLNNLVFVLKQLSQIQHRIIWIPSFEINVTLEIDIGSALIIRKCKFHKEKLSSD